MSVCRLQRGKLDALYPRCLYFARPGVYTGLRASDIASCSAFELCEKGLKLADSTAGRIRTISVLQAMRKYKDALQMTDDLIESFKERAMREVGGGQEVLLFKEDQKERKNARSIDDFFVSTYGKAPVFSQLYLPGGPEVLPLPLFCENDDLHLDDWLHSLVSKRNQIIFLAGRYGEEKK
jgi:hypothetical protein